MDRGRALPVPAHPLVGRAPELEAVRAALLDHRVRLLTLTGPGGVGKTHLALAAAPPLLPAFPGGAWFVPLAAVTEASLVAGAIAEAVGLPDTDDRALPERLAAALAQRRALLLLDNFEQVVDAAPLISALLTGCPGLQVLVTSRRPLRLTGEQELRVWPLAVPAAVPDGPAGGAPSPASAASGVWEAPAVVLFTHRARAVRTGAVRVDADAAVVAEICRRLDGLPLALELAAARLRHLTAPALLEGLQPALPLLTGGPRDAPARHHTLRQTIAWSEALLDPAERALFRRLGVFVGGCTAAAAGAVTRRSPAPAEAGLLDEDPGAATPAGTPATLERLIALADRSLLQHEPEPPGGPVLGEARFGMLETVREYAAERLERAGEAEATRRRHAAYFLGLAGRAAGAAHGPDQGTWFDRLERERGNLRAALGWTIARGDTAAAVRFVEALRWFWEVRGHAAEGRRQTAAVLALPALSGDVAPGQRARALVVAAHLAHATSDLAAAAALGGEGAALGISADGGRVRADALLWLAVARFRLGGSGGAGWPAAGAPALATGEVRALLEESRCLWRDAGEAWGVAQALECLGMVVRDAGDPRGARPHYEAALALRRELGDARGIAQTLQSLANLALLQNEYATAIACSEESLATAQALGDRRRVATSLYTLSAVAHALGDSTLARRHLERQLAAAQAAGDEQWTALAACWLAALAAGRGEAGTAARLYALSLRRSVRQASREGTAACFVGLASLALDGGQPERAARLLGAAEGACEAPGFFDAHLEVWRRGPVPHRGAEADLRRRLAGHPHAPTWIEVGRLLPLEQAVEEAVAIAECEEGGGSAPPEAAASEFPPPDETAPQAPQTRLTPREREVAALVAQGATNRQIATRLVIAERTAMRHVEHILNKLGVHSRAEIAAWAARRGLDRPAAPA